METIRLIINAFYFVLPAYFANMAPVIFDKLGLLKNLKNPIDGGRKINGEEIFGRGKTWRGIVSAVILSVLVCFVQAWLFQFEYFKFISLFNYRHFFVLFIFGILAGLGAILGDLAKSFFKRRLCIKSGRSWPIFDQLDFIVGFFIFTFWLIWPGWSVVLTVFFITLILHPLVNIFSYLLKIKKVWW